MMQHQFFVKGPTQVLGRWSFVFGGQVGLPVDSQW